MYICKAYHQCKKEMYIGDNNNNNNNQSTGQRKMSTKITTMDHNSLRLHDDSYFSWLVFCGLSYHETVRLMTIVFESVN